MNSNAPTINRPLGQTFDSCATAPSVAGLTYKDIGSGPQRIAEITLDNVYLAMTRNSSTVTFGGLKILDLPAGAFRILGSTAKITSISRVGTNIAEDFDGDFSVGTATASNNATLTGTEANLIPSTATTQAASGTSVGGSATSLTMITALTDSSGGTASNTLAAITNSYVEATIENTVASLAAKINELVSAANGTMSLDGTSADPDVYFNLLIDGGDVSTGNDAVRVSGTIRIAYLNLGDI